MSRRMPVAGWIRQPRVSLQLCALIIIIIAQLATVARLTTLSNKGDSFSHHSNRHDTTHNSNSLTRSGASRSSGGMEWPVFQWIVVLWRNPIRLYWTEPGALFENFMTGIAIRINDFHILCNIEARLRVENDESYYHRNHDKSWIDASPSFIQYRPSQTINVTQGLPWGPKVKGYTIQHVVTLNENIALFHLTHRCKKVPDPILDELPGLEPEDFPIIETNVSAPADDCYAYGYSFPRYDPSPVRTFSRWPVKLLSCVIRNESKCVMALKREHSDMENSTLWGEVCHSLSDVGGPVMCGVKGNSTGKLTYIITQHHLDPIRLLDDHECVGDFDVLRLADHYEFMNRSFNHIAPAPIWPMTHWGEG